MYKAALIVALPLLAGCATLTKGTSQILAVNTPGAPGAKCTLSSPVLGSRVVVTPASLDVEKSKENISVRCSKECYQDAVAVISSETEAMTAGNVLVGGVIGLGVDAASGAMNKYTPQTDVAMVPIQGCRARA